MDSGFRPSRTGTTDSDMSDEFFGFAGSRSKVKTEEPSPLDDPLADGLFSTPASKPVASKANELFSDDSDIFSISSEKNKESAVVSNGKISADEDDLFSINKTKEESKTKVAEPLGEKNLFGSKIHDDENIFSSVNEEKKIQSSNQKTPSKAEEPKISSPLDNDDLFSVLKDDKTVEKTKAAQPSKTEAKPVAKEKKPSLDEDLFSSNSTKNESKPDKKETEKPTKAKAFSSPLGEDDDLFVVSAPVKKDVKSTVDSATKKTASPVTNKKTTPKTTAVLDVSTFLRVSRHFFFFFLGEGGRGGGDPRERLTPDYCLEELLPFSGVLQNVNLCQQLWMSS